MPIFIARIRVPSFVIGMLLVLMSPLHHLAWVSWVGVALVVSSVVTTFLPGGRIKREPVPVHSPVHGRWIAANSPADKVPSHGVHSAGQTYAVDLVYWPESSTVWKAVHRWPLVQPPEAFPGFGQPVFAPADGRVVRTRGWWRDHWSRNSWPALVYLFLEGSFRELLGRGGLLGNHVVLDLGDGVYAALAHLNTTRSKSRTGSSSEQASSSANAGTQATPASRTSISN